MGTSRSLSTPSGGDWTPVKKRVTELVASPNAAGAEKPNSIVGGAVRAAGGLGRIGSSGGSGGARGRAASGRGGGTGGSRSSRAVGRSTSGLGGFGAALQAGGLVAGLRRLGLEELKGRPAAEVIARIAERLAEGVDGLAGEVVAAALRDAIFEVAALEGDLTYENLDASLQSFLGREGVEGLIETFLTHLVTDQVWMLIESHVSEKAADARSADATASAVEGACRTHVREMFADLKREGTFDGVDWFGREGIALARHIVSALEERLRALGSEKDAA